jgi:hypothetical protein
MPAITPGRSGEWSIGVRAEETQPMKTFEFSIVASGVDPGRDDFESRFYEAGCDDATVSFQRGHTILDFAREAETADAAIASALADVRSVGATVDRIEPDPLVTLSEIAVRAGVTRAAISQYAGGRRSSGFPAPAAKVTTSSPLWRWAAVARWFAAHGKVGSDVADEAQAVEDANEALRTAGRAA